MRMLGGKEIFADDDEALVEVLEKVGDTALLSSETKLTRKQQAGVEPTKLYKANGVHNWSLFDAVSVILYRVYAPGSHTVRLYPGPAWHLQDQFKRCREYARIWSAAYCRLYCKAFQGVRMARAFIRTTYDVSMAPKSWGYSETRCSEIRIQ